MKVWAPMMALQAWGKVRLPYGMNYWIYPYGFQSYAIFQRRRTWHGMITVLMRYSDNCYRNSSYQQAYRTKFAAGVYAWQQLETEWKDLYNALKFPERMSGFNRFMHYYLKDESAFPI